MFLLQGFGKVFNALSKLGFLDTTLRENLQPGSADLTWVGKLYSLFTE